MLLNRPIDSTDEARPGEPLLKWEETPCPLCGRDDNDLLSESADPIPERGPGLRFVIVTCRHCRLTYVNPRPTVATIAQFYPPQYPPHLPRRITYRNRPPSRFWSWLRGRPCPERRGLLPCPGPGRLLDFGCGEGSYLHLMADNGWKVTGVDVSPRVANELCEHVPGTVLTGTLPHPGLPPGSFEIVTAWQSLEHVHQPLATLRAAYEVLVPGGKLIVAVPNFDSLGARWFGEHWFGLDLPRHLTHFTPQTLTGMLQTAGYQVQSMRGLVHADWLRSSANHAIAAGVRGLTARMMRWKVVSKVAEWGCYALGRPQALVAVAQRPE